MPLLHLPETPRRTQVNSPWQLSALDPLNLYVCNGCSEFPHFDTFSEGMGFSAAACHLSSFCFRSRGKWIGWRKEKKIIRVYLNDKGARHTTTCLALTCSPALLTGGITYVTSDWFFSLTFLFYGSRGNCDVGFTYLIYLCPHPFTQGHLTILLY